MIISFLKKSVFHQNFLKENQELEVIQTQNLLKMKSKDNLTKNIAVPSRSGENIASRLQL
jgi:hypothetical protein